MIFELRQNGRRLGVYGRGMIGALWAGAMVLGLPLEELDAVPVSWDEAVDDEEDSDG